MNRTAIIIAAAILLPITAHAGEHAMHGSHAGAMDSGATMQDGTDGMQGMFLVKKEIDGYTVSFHAMKAAEGMRHGGSYNFMVKVEKEGKPADITAINSKVIHPDGHPESKMMMKMGEWYMAGYDLDHEGRHQLMVLFRTADAAKHFGGVYAEDLR